MNAESSASQAAAYPFYSLNAFYAPLTKRRRKSTTPS